MGEAYPEIVEHAELIRRIVDSEEERFAATLRQGLAFLDEEIEALEETVGRSLTEPRRSRCTTHTASRSS